MQWPKEKLARGYLELWALLRSQDERISRLEAIIAKNSTNSSMPPSTDSPFRKPAPAPKLASAIRRAVGGQLGHPGTTLLRKDPDVIVTHDLPARCLLRSPTDPNAGR